MAELGLNVFQVLQNELIAREGNRSTLGLGFRLAILEEKIANAEAIARNSRIWRLNHVVSPVKALTPEARARSEALRKKLLSQKGSDRRDEKDPTKLIRDSEVWEVHRDFPKNLLEFKELQFRPDRIRSLLEFYDVKVYGLDGQTVDVHLDDELRDIRFNIEACMEELSMSWGLNWFKIDGLVLPPARAQLSRRSLDV